MGSGTGKWQKEALAMDFYTVLAVLVTGTETRDKNSYTMHVNWFHLISSGGCTNVSFLVLTAAL